MTEPEGAAPLETLPAEPRRCANPNCGAPLVRRENEQAAKWRDRKYCRPACHHAVQRQGRAVTVCTRCGERPRAPGQKWCARCQQENKKRLHREVRAAELTGPAAVIHDVLTREVGPRLVVRGEDGQMRPATGRPVLAGSCRRCRELAEQLHEMAERMETAEREAARLARVLDARGPAVLVRKDQDAGPTGDPYAGHGPGCAWLFCGGAVARERYVASVDPALPPPD